jgi:CRISPR-associated endonuclease/helicase Cas3
VTDNIRRSHVETLSEDEFVTRAGQLVRVEKDDPPFCPLEMQRKLAFTLATGKRVIAVQPTGGGKTLAATLPFAANMLAPGQMCFMTPLRTLTSAQSRTLAERIDGDVAARYLKIEDWDVRQQTGPAPQDPDFEAPVVVTTFDQAVSSALRISYSASKRRRTINAGAVLGSYLVADELHLFPRGKALTTLLCLLQHRPPELPFLLMTATLTPSIARALADLLEARLVADPLRETDRRTLGVAAQHRTVHWQPTPLTAQQIIQAAHDHPDDRILVVVNTVQRAIDLARELESALGRDGLRGLHSRFYQEHRQRHEGAIIAAFGKQRSGGIRIAIATQVVEVGLDLSADLLFTELAPASALAQRWGRAARWGGTATIVVAPPPDERKIYPYVGGDHNEVVASTRTWLGAHAGGEGVVMDDTTERELVEFAHDAADQRWLDGLGPILTTRAEEIGKAIAEGRYELAGSLIRHVNTRTILICGNPENSLPAPLRMQGFSLAPGSLMPLVSDKGGQISDKALEDDEGEGMISFDLSPEVTWKLKRPIWPEDDQASERGANVVSGWTEVKTRAEILVEPLLVVHPAGVSYDEYFGLSLRAGGQETDERYWAKPARNIYRHWSTRTAQARETLEHHVSTMLALLESYPVLWPRVSRIAPLVEQWCGWPKGTLLRLTRTAIVVHDAGKLSPEWQQGIRAYQQAIKKQATERWLVHSDDAGGIEAKWAVPHHALSGAGHTVKVGASLDEQAGTTDRAQAQPSNVLFTAVATHHSPTLGNLVLGQDELLDEPALSALNDLLGRHQLPARAGEVRNLNLMAARKLVDQQHITREKNACEAFALALVIRMLRLSDGWSQDPDRLADIRA